jgi:deoxyribonuclease-4
LDHAQELEIDIAQFFLMPQKKNKYIRLMRDEVKAFVARRAELGDIYVHSSYWINLANGNKESINIAEAMLRKELRIAKELQLTGVVIHPGSYKGHPKTEEDPTGYKAGIQGVARFLNKFLKKEPDIKIILENTAHSAKSIGSNFEDFVAIRALLDKPEQLKICLDIAHSFAFGYDVTDTKKFVAMLEKTVGIESIALIHLHDSAEPCGSSRDRHALPGEGEIGVEALKNVVMHPKLVNKPIILELPVVSTGRAVEILNFVRSWQG